MINNNVKINMNKEILYILLSFCIYFMNRHESYKYQFIMAILFSVAIPHVGKYCIIELLLLKCIDYLYSKIENKIKNDLKNNN